MYAREAPRRALLAGRGEGSGGIVSRAAETSRTHASIPEPRADMWQTLHATFVREARESGTAGRSRCRTLFLGDSITEAMRGTQFGEFYDELAGRRAVFEKWFPLNEARAFGISGDRTQNVLRRIRDGELSFRHPPGVVVLCVGTNNLGRDNDGPADTFLGIRAVVLEILQTLPGTRVLLTGILPRGPAKGRSSMPPAAGEAASYADEPRGVRLDGERRKNSSPSSKYAQPGAHTAAIEEVNARLKALARGSGGVVAFVDCASAFLSDDGASIRPERMRDVLHPTAEGMHAWFQILKPAVEALRNAPAPSESWYTGASVAPASENGTLESVDGGVRLALSRCVLSHTGPHTTALAW